MSRVAVTVLVTINNLSPSFTSIFDAVCPEFRQLTSTWTARNGKHLSLRPGNMSLTVTVNQSINQSINSNEAGLPRSSGSSSTGSSIKHIDDGGSGDVVIV